MKKTSVELELAGKKITLQTGEMAPQATSSILARMGDTMVLVTVVEGNLREDIDYFPLTVEYVERLYAGGRIKGSRWVKREGRPSDDAILTARLIDRSIRPLFPKEFKKEVQVIATVLSVDGENDPAILSLIAVSAALTISKIPWNGPISAVRVGYVKENGNGNAEFVVNSGAAEGEFSDLDLVVTQTKEKTLMLEAGALQVPNDIMVEAIKKAQIENKTVIEFIEKLAKGVGDKKEEVTPDTKLVEAVKLIEKSYIADVVILLKNKMEKESGSSNELIEKILIEQKLVDPEFELDKKTIAKAIDYVLYKNIRENVVKKGIRPDGRKLDQIREISSRVSILPRTHGSAIFQRENTQALSVVTLGSPRMEQLIESAEGEEVKRYIHHYSGLPYSFGQTGRVGTPSRREIGHGALAERALLAVIPKQEIFPYTIRVVSEVLSQNGSSSMASTCGSSLALMDAGVPITKPVAGISIGMMSIEDKYELITDIIGLEDFSGDMDFKVAGTKDGITAIQLDVKNSGLTIGQVTDIFERAKVARLLILDKMLATMPNYREEVSEYAPKIEMVKIPVEKIGEVIGPGGKVIKNIISSTGATVDVEDDGSVAISGTSEEAVQNAVDWIKALVREVTPGEIFDGEVKRILPFGAFVEILPGKEGMVHVSKMSTEFVKDPNEIVSIGQKVKVRVVEVDEQHRINLSMLFGEDAEGGNKREASTQGANTGSRRVVPAASGRSSAPVRSYDPQPRTQSDHPLAMQFRRERETEWRAKNMQNRPRTGSGMSRYNRKPSR
ncbi:MAG: polyribonucleotide nucleotidyltransferase [Candidatus Levybacteria bacterium CG_4_10_14_0_8_um_filter_35_23]|nr:MAG: polyribonucleotide nucleotidyltransferase [Candidatus Levybacteria bacterium CG_4_10_14_0_8_um_filter_35_23]